MVAKMDDVRRAVTTDFKAPGDLVYLLGRTYDELGGSELYKLFNEIGANVPRVRRDEALRLYHEVAAANDERLIESCHDLSDGGLAVALAECCFGGDLGALLDVTQDDLSLLATLFSETHSRFVASVRPEHRIRFEAVMGRDARLLGEVTLERRMRLRWQGRTVVDLAVDRLVEAWSGGLGLVDHVDGVDRVDRAPAGQLWPSRSSTVSTSSTSSTTGAAKSHTTVKALVLTGFGINCEEETAAAFRLAGAEARTVHLNAVLDGACSIHEFDVLALPGGFSFGDDLGAGKVLANKLRTRRLPSRRLLVDEIRAFLRDGKLVLGICNGFQALVKMGLLPDVRGEGVQEVSLTTNDSGHFEDRWCRLVVHHPVRTPFLEDIEMLELPVRHGEGKLVIRGAEVREHILARSLCCLSYCDRDGRPTARYPDNPNGSDLCCAALTDETGQVLGMMPHPEAYLSQYNHPDWPARVRRGAVSTEGDGLKIFRNIVRHMEAGK
jgi:phosphoribosylformylglycinamidine synthase